MADSELENIQPLHDTEPSESVAVVVTTFNDAEFLLDALRSVFAQTHAPKEVIVVDDGSDESPAYLVKTFPAVTLIRKKNGGLASARNVGLGQAKCSGCGLGMFSNSPTCGFGLWRTSSHRPKRDTEERLRHLYTARQ